MAIKYLAILFVVILFGVFVYLSSRARQTQADPLQKEFLSGKVPTNLDGLYKGSTDAQTDWKGKKFDAKAQTGINVFGNTNEEKYVFKTYVGQGLADDREVLKIDYNQSQNPFWLRFIVDELVEVDNGKYLGKLHIKLLPKISFSLGYFSLRK